MKKVLIIAYGYPPIGGSGVQRTTKFVKYLRNFGYEPIVLTRTISKRGLKDESMMSEIPEGLNIIRTPAWDLTELPGVFVYPGKIVARKFLIPDSELIWAKAAYKFAVKAIEAHNIDIIYSTSYPYSDHLLGLWLKKKYPHIPFVVDFRDEWTNNPYLKDNPHVKFRANIERNMEKDIINHSECLITNTPIMLKNFISDNSLDPDYSFCIPNGYDEEDFEHIDIKQSNNPKLTMTYTGSFYGRRNPESFLQALSECIKENKISADSIKVQLIGNFKAQQINNYVLKYQLNGIIDIISYMPHNECIKKTIDSDILLLIENNGPGAEAFYTGKVFEYIRTGRPILAMIPENGVAADLIRETETGFVSDSSDVEKTKENLTRLFALWKMNKLSITPRWDIIHKFERKKLTEELARVFEIAESKSNK